MNFEYNSTQGVKKIHPPEFVAALREYLASLGYKEGSNQITLGEFQRHLLEFRYRGHRFMIHQLEPIFIYCAQFGLWPVAQK